jgi:tetratricopeptide (TPR) repeat protein
MVSLRYAVRLGSFTLALATSAGAFADDILLVPNTTVKQAASGHVRGVVQSETQAEVTVKLGANTTAVPTDQIISIHYDSQPAQMTSAEINENAGQLAKAADLYKKAAQEAAGKPFIQQAARFKQAEVTADLALSDPSKAAEAIGLLDEFLKEFPGGRHTAPVLECMARVQLKKGDAASVEKTIATLAKLPQGADRAAVLRAKVSARQGDHAKAAEELDAIIKAAPEGSLRRREARLAKAESLVVLKKYPEAEAEVRAVIKTTPAEDAQAQSAAYNTLGDCLKAAGRPKDALFAFLHTDVLYSKDKEQHPRALAQISQLWRELKRDDRADEVWQRLKQDYPQSPWLASPGGNP